jgi:serine/threonine protein kinase
MDNFRNVVLLRQSTGASVYSACRCLDKASEESNLAEIFTSQKQVSIPDPASTNLDSNVSANKQCKGCCALKVFDTSRLTKCGVDMLKNEVKVMNMLSHPNIIKFYESSRTQDTFVIVEEYGTHGDVFDHIISHGSLPFGLACYYFDQLVGAVSFMHTCCVAHRDIKPENMVFDGCWTLKVCDFGSAVSWPSDFKHLGRLKNGLPKYDA